MIGAFWCGRLAFVFRDPVASRVEVLTRLAGLRQYQRGGHRAPHKPLLVLLALGRLVRQPHFVIF